LRGRSVARDAAIHRVSGAAGRVDGSVTGSQWIAAGYALAITRVRKGRDGKDGIVLCLCLCEEGAERGTRQSIVSRGPGAELIVRLLAHSGSPRAMHSR